MRLEHHLVGGYVRYISPHIIIIINKSRRGHFHRAYFDDVHLRQGERYNCLLRYVLYNTKHITSRTAAKICLPTTTSESVFEEVSKSSTDQLCCSSSSLDGGYTDTEVGELRDMESYQFKPEMDEIPAKWRSRRKVSSPV